MDDLVKKREDIIKAPKTVKEYQNQKKIIYENKGPTYLSSPVRGGKEDPDLDNGMAGFEISKALREAMKWDNDKTEEEKSSKE